MQPLRNLAGCRFCVRDVVWAILLIGVVVARIGEASRRDEAFDSLQRELDATKVQVAARTKELIAAEEWMKTSEAQIVGLLSRLPYE